MTVRTEERGVRVVREERVVREVQDVEEAALGHAEKIVEEVVGSEVREERVAPQEDTVEEVQAEVDQLIEADPLQSPLEHNRSRSC